MEFLWTQFKEMKKPQEGDPYFVTSINRIKLFAQKDQNKVKFNCEDNVGYWDYVWDAHGPSYMAIEFKASHYRQHTRRHCLVQTTENTFELLPSDNALYQVDEYWNHCKEVHQNAYPIVMQRLQIPCQVPYRAEKPEKENNGVSSDKADKEKRGDK